ncbi:minor tail protein [Rhodobacter phage RcWhiteOak]|nr:minor tail protein [Rhodobacter phage RcJoli]UUV45051.1 minor tail protein [Rhodobacter phage RcWhiteOak]
MSASVALELDVNAITGNQWNPKIETALLRSINKTADRARTLASQDIREQVAFPASYLAPSAKRLFVSTKATKASPFEAVISGRDRPTSLARFSNQKPLGGGQRHRGGQVAVTVKPGVRRYIKRAFLITLNNSNVGLAVRTDGGPPNNAYAPKEIGKNLWLLYGPSVDQVLSAASNGGGIYEEIVPETLDFLNDEFNRQLDLLNAL